MDSETQALIQILKRDIEAIRNRQARHISQMNTLAGMLNREINDLYVFVTAFDETLKEINSIEELNVNREPSTKGEEGFNGA